MSFLGEGTLTRRRYAVGAYSSTGGWAAGPSTESTFMGSLQPLAGRDRQVLPEGVRASASRKIYCLQGTLRTDDQHSGVSADEVIDAQGRIYTVIHVDDAHPLLPHERVYLQRKREEAS
ncbi:MAG: hypothetical protein AAGA48_27610 [Myxococcota bacterium]